MTEVYRNLNRRKWSIREGGRVVGHVDVCCLRDVSFHVSVAARQRAIRIGQRAVMAWARGVLCEAHRWPSAERIRFSPFEGPSFMAGEFEIDSAKLVFFDADGTCWGIL
ncbi:hypothetical protein MKK55_18655 [Methylobacterium sp. J-059]|uniref:hypothetical protein n=1 Tax=Methylobacterium sp. J-059 TaxID=2836643 RepID=UPI001FBBC345|nr:hypothetical protein [Methylobacterium sp. J-059]MCJ2040952.1 hypothetical protein [Methylobacterium sp. J-059]